MHNSGRGTRDKPSLLAEPLGGWRGADSKPRPPCSGGGGAPLVLPALVRGLQQEVSSPAVCSGSLEAFLFEGGQLRVRGTCCTHRLTDVGLR